MSWRIVTLDGTGRESLSSTVPSRKAALAWAADLAREGTRVVRITGPSGRTIEGPALDALSAGGRLRRSA